MMQKSFVLVLRVLVVMVMVGLWVATPTRVWSADSAKTTGPALVGVMKVDGTTVRGTLVSSDPEGVTIQPPTKIVKTGKSAKDAPAPVTPDPVVVAWKDIKAVSNGLTYRKALDVWKAQHLSELCETCRGERMVWCPTCKGTQHDPAAGKECKTCGGELLVDCKTAHCEKGQIPCPAKCLKLTEGTWVKHADGVRWRTFPMAKSALANYSEHHLGHLIVLDYKENTATDVGVCPTCGGTMKIDDPACHGTGKVPCPTCSARKDAAPCPDHCDHGRVVCPDCKGTGLKKAA